MFGGITAQVMAKEDRLLPAPKPSVKVPYPLFISPAFPHLSRICGIGCRDCSQKLFKGLLQLLFKLLSVSVVELGRRVLVKLLKECEFSAQGRIPRLPSSPAYQPLNFGLWFVPARLRHSDRAGLRSNVFWSILQFFFVKRAFDGIVIRIEKGLDDGFAVGLRPLRWRFAEAPCPSVGTFHILKTRQLITQIFYWDGSFRY